MLQPGYNLYDRGGLEGPLLDLCRAEGLGVITYFGLAKGFLSGKYRSNDDLGKSPRGGGVAATSTRAASRSSARSTRWRPARRDAGAKSRSPG